MDSINLLCRLSLSSISIVLALTVFAAASRSRGPEPRSGKVVIDGKGDPLEVDVKVWPDSNETKREGGCPQYGQNPLDATKSSARDGTFTIRVDPERNPIVTAIYCAQGWVSRVDRDLRASDEAVFADPILMVSNSAQVTDLRFERLIVTTLNNLAYFRSVSEERFDSAVRRIGSRTDGLLAAVKAWQPRSGGLTGDWKANYALNYATALLHSPVNRSLRESHQAPLADPILMDSNTVQVTDLRFERVIITALNNLAYFRSVNQEKFDSAARRVGRSEGVPAAVAAWTQRLG